MDEQGTATPVDPGLQGPARIRRRRVYYISGFDPRGPSHYHALYRDGAPAQGALTGQRLTVGACERIDRLITRWRVDDAAGVAVEIDFMRWDDLVRTQWHRRYWPLVRDYLAAIAELRRTGVGAAIRTLTLAGWWSVFFPLIALTANLVVPLLLAVGCWWLAFRWPGGRLGPWLAIAPALTVALGSWWLLRRLAGRLKADWLMRSTVFSCRHAGGRLPELEERLDRFAERVRDACGDASLDEIVVVGHSSGADLAVSVLARALRLASATDPRLGLLTLGHTIPLIGLHPAATRLREELAQVGATALTWIDVSAPPDRICFPLTDPLAACGLPATGRPRLVPARFHKQFPPIRYRLLRENRYRIHFQYMMAAELPGGFDYFRTTAGPWPLSAVESK